MTVWFTSDTHYGHGNIIQFASRPFQNVEEMDEAMIARWNHLVKPSDTIYHLGDFALCSPERATLIARRLPGFKHLIFGNHDKKLRRNLEFVGCWVWARDYAEISVEGRDITLCHYAMEIWNKAHHGTWQLYGHSHGTLPDKLNRKSTDVGVDCWDYAPVSFDTLRDVMAKRRWAAVDRHGAL